MENFVQRKAKRLIVTADDFGLTHGINEAIVRSYRQGIVTSASLIVTGPAFESAADLARQYPGLDIGLHLDLADDPIAFAMHLALGRIAPADLERRIRHQFEKALDAGVRLTHI